MSPTAVMACDITLHENILIFYVHRHVLDSKYTNRLRIRPVSPL